MSRSAPEYGRYRNQALVAIIGFVVLSYAISWLVWWPLASQGGAPPESPLRYLHLLGGLGPAAAGLLVVRVSDGPVGVERLTKQVMRWRVGLGWHAIAWLLPFALLWIAVMLARMTGDTQPIRFDRSAEYPQLSLPIYVMASVVAYGFGEEIGWRGVLLPRLQARRSALTAADMMSVIWAGWHLPLFWFAPGMARMIGPEIVGWYLSILTASVLFTWLFNGTGGSIPICAIFHGVMDVAFLASGPSQLPSFLGGLITVLGVAVLVRFGPSSLAAHPRVVDEPLLV
ncbi:MAG: CPBP family intramembrane metalloprotease [Acidobacteria bacterium]|nr:CPBP family intramembrane metalloprotease [Acidobacteriota bacterium]